MYRVSKKKQTPCILRTGVLQFDKKYLCTIIINFQCFYTDFYPDRQYWNDTVWYICTFLLSAPSMSPSSVPSVPSVWLRCPSSPSHHIIRITGTLSLFGRLQLSFRANIDKLAWWLLPFNFQPIGCKTGSWSDLMLQTSLIFNWSCSNNVGLE